MSIAVSSAGWATGGAVPNFSTSANPTGSRLIPQVWSSKLLVKFYKQTVLALISNTDYEGDISNMGDKVHIRTIPDITIRDYQKGQELVIETPNSAAVELTIDKAKYWSFVTDDVDRAQSDLNYVEGWTTDASTQMKITMDTEVLLAVAAQAGISDATHFGVTTNPLALTKDNVIKFVVDAMRFLDDRNVPEGDRFVVMPPVAVALIKLSDLKDAALTGDATSILRNGRVGMIDRANIIQSNCLPSGSTSVTTGSELGILFGQKSAITFATQLTKNEGPLRDAKVFGDIYRGLMVYGFKVLKTAALGFGVVTVA